MFSELYPYAVWLLLPVAAASGWWAASRSHQHRQSERRHLPSGYFKGLNYLLNEQPDKAIETFIQVLEVDGDTVETHLALGNLFRRRGEVDRAIRVHQNLIARPALNARQRYQALLELGMDYMRAGLLDRAETLFKELVEAEQYTLQSLRQLIDIYQQERDWDLAIASAQRLHLNSGQAMAYLIAQFYCEKAREEQIAGNSRNALQHLRLALKSDPGCVRASLFEAELLLDAGDPGTALSALKRVEKQDPAFLSEILTPLTRCYQSLGREHEHEQYLEQLLQQHGGDQLLLRRVELMQERHGAEAAARLLATALQDKPSLAGLVRLIDLSLQDSRNLSGSLSAVADVVRNLSSRQPEYACVQCGFTGRSLHWQCPGCQHWNTIKAIQGTDSD